MSLLIERLDRLLKRPRGPGPLPAFSKLHVLKAIDLVGRMGPLSRASLSRELGIGEGAVRTLLKKLVSADLVRTSRSGCVLTEEGMALWTELNARLAKRSPIARSAISLGAHGFAILVRDGAKKVRLGVEQRDEAVRAGAKGALVLIAEEGRLKMPGVSDDIRADYPDLFEEVAKSLEPEEGDAIVIAYADDPLVAEYGALAAALSLL